MNIYDKLGLKQYINALATVTIYGGSIMPDEVVEAMREASQSYVNILDLHKKAGDYIAKLTHNEAAFIPNGAASGMVLATAAAIAGDDPEARANLPDTEGLKNEIIILAANRVGYDFAIKMAGGKFVTYGDETSGTTEQLEAAITDKTAAIFVFYFDHRMDSQPPLSVQAEIAKRHGIYLFVDAAAQIPRKENLWKFTQDGADLAIFSGGKGLRGPQSSGLIVGKKEIIDRIRSMASPNGGIGRPMKVGKEEIVGLMTAVRLYMEQDEAALLADYERQVQAVIDAFRGDAAVDVVRDFPSEAGQPMPRAKLNVKPGALTVDAGGLSQQLMQCTPGILVAAGGSELWINPQTLLAGEIDIVIDRLKQVIDANRAQ